MSIIHAFVRWVVGVLTPGSGKRRAGSRPVRPYVLEAERSRERGWERQAWRRFVLVLTAGFGVDLDRRVIGAEGVA